MDELTTPTTAATTAGAKRKQTPPSHGNAKAQKVRAASTATSASACPPELYATQASSTTPPTFAGTPTKPVLTTRVASIMAGLASESRDTLVALVGALQARVADMEHDIDSADRGDAAACSEYALAISKHFLAAEKSGMPSRSYMSRQMHIQPKMRQVIVDWLVDVHQLKFAMEPETLHIAVGLFDRFLDKDTKIRRGELQLVGVTALFIAAKYEETRLYPTHEFVEITEDTYKVQELTMMETRVLEAVDYRITFPTALHFVKRFVKAAGTRNDRVAHFAHFVVERSLQVYEHVKHCPSRIAAAAVYIARQELGECPAWNETLVHHSTYKADDLTHCVDDLKAMLRAPLGQLTAVVRKFASEKYMGVSQYPFVD